MQKHDNYIYPFQLSRYTEAINRELPCKADTEILCRSVDKGILLPVKKEYQENLFGSGGVLDYDGKYVEESAVISKGHIIEKSDDTEPEYYVGARCVSDLSKIEARNETVVYLGYIYNHWGHFLVDFSSRLWFAKDNTAQNYKYVFIVNENERFEPIKPIKDFLECLNLSDIEYINKPTKFEKVIIPVQSYITNMYYSQKHLNLFDYVAEKAMESCDQTNYPDKVYFTRISYKKAERTEVGEQLLCKTLADNGFRIVSPEQCSLFEQIRYIRNAAIVAGIAGTIPHNMLFAKEKQTLWIFNKTYIINMMQMDINSMKHLNATYVDCYACCQARPLGGGPFLITKTNQLMKFCKAHNININYPDSMLKKEIKDYLDLISVSKEYHPQVIKNMKSVHYFNPEFAQRFFDDYLSIMYKPSVFFLMKNRAISILRLVKQRVLK